MALSDAQKQRLAEINRQGLTNLAASMAYFMSNEETNKAWRNGFMKAAQQKGFALDNTFHQPGGAGRAIWQMIQGGDMAKLQALEQALASSEPVQAGVKDVCASQSASSNASATTTSASSSSSDDATYSPLPDAAAAAAKLNAAPLPTPLGAGTVQSLINAALTDWSDDSDLDETDSAELNLAGSPRGSSSSDGQYFDLSLVPAPADESRTYDAVPPRSSTSGTFSAGFFQHASAESSASSTASSADWVALNPLESELDDLFDLIAEDGVSHLPDNQIVLNALSQFEDIEHIPDTVGADGMDDVQAFAEMLGQIVDRDTGRVNLAGRNDEFMQKLNAAMDAVHAQRRPAGGAAGGAA